ncbi:hypothetical protein ES703_92214 [subsurface metagenome]
MPATLTMIRCNRCGGNIVNEDGQRYCLLCNRPYRPDWRGYGRIGGLQTYLRYGREYMSEVGKRGGRPRLRQLSAPEAQSKQNGGSRLPNRLSELKELWERKRGEFCCN